jgi:hypothetical protein
MTGGRRAGPERGGARRGPVDDFGLGVAILGLVSGLAASPVLAVPLPPGGSDRFSREDEATARAALTRLGLGVEEARARLARLSPEERHRLAQAAETLEVGGAHRTTLGVVLALLVLLLALAIAI